MPTIPRPDQVADFARHRAVRALGRPDRAGASARGLLRRVGGGRGRRAADYARLLHELDQGHQPALEELTGAVAHQLDAADAALARGRQRRATALADRALRLAYHPTAHTGPAGSPLMLHADAFLAPLRASAAARALLFEPDPPARRSSSTADREPGPRRVLVLCHSSWTFIRRVVADLERHSDIELRILDVSRLPLAERPTHALAVRMRSAWNRTGRLQPVPEALVEDLTWADTVLVEWGTYPLTWASLLDLAPYRVRLVARIHRFEVLTPYPLLARSAALDAVAFVSPPLRSLMTRISPRLAQAGSTPVLRNVHDLEPFAPGPARSAHRIVQVGWAAPVKDVEFTLDVLERLRAIDERYTLALVGPTLEDVMTPRTADRARAVLARIQRLGDAVEVLGVRDDVPEILGGAGFLLSSSRSEGTHESVAEAAAAGCVPVVRDWPEIAPWGGAAMIYPRAWVVEDVDGAVARIRALADPRAFAAEAEACRDWVLADRAPERIRQGYLELLGAPPSAATGPAPTGTPADAAPRA